MSKIDFQDVLSANLAILCLISDLMFIIKFRFDYRGDFQNMNSHHFSHINV